MNILFVNHMSPHSASFLRQHGLGKELAATGHRVAYIARSPSRGRTIEPGNEIPSLTYWDEPFPLPFIQNISKLMKVSKDYDLLHVNKAYPFTSTLLYPEKIFAGKRIVLDWEDWDGIGGYINLARKNLASRFALGFFEEVVPPKCDSIIAVSNILVERAKKRGIPAERVNYVPNGYDESLFNRDITGEEIRKKYDLFSKPVILLLSALRSYELDNFALILRALKLVAKQLPDCRLVLAGQGEIEKIYQLAQEMGIRDNLVYLGYLPHSKIPEVIASVDVAVHVLSDNIYFRSSSPMVVPEYMAMGKPVVASKVGELNVMLGNGAGVLVGQQSPESFGKGILDIINDPSESRRIGQRAFEKARSTYSYKTLAKRVESAYEKAIALPRSWS